MNLQDKVIVVTGGGNGIGEALCLRFAQEKPEAIVVIDLEQDNAQRVADLVGGIGYNVDVSDEAAMTTIVADIEQRYGRIDLFFSNAGIISADGPGGICGDGADLATWELNMRVNVLAHVIAARAVLPKMIERGEGYICSTASAAGLLAQVGSSVYSVTKHAAIAFAESVAIHHGDQGIKVSVLCPQAVRTRMFTSPDDPERAAEQAAAAAADGVLEPVDVAQSVVDAIREEQFLITPHAKVLEYVQGKARNPDRWLKGMRRVFAQLSS